MGTVTSGGGGTGGKGSALAGATVADAKGGTVAQAGTVAQSGSANGIAGASVVGGSSPTSAGQTFAGATTTILQGGSAVGTAGNSSLTGAAGSNSEVSCPRVTSYAGSLLKPPSNGFEVDMVNWLTTSETTNALSRKTNTNVCEGSSYLSCNGAFRTAGWDGPKFDVLRHLVPGHQYSISLLVRFSPDNAPPAAANIYLTSSKVCADSSVQRVYNVLQQERTVSNWVRLSGLLDTSLTGCAALSNLMLYVATDDTEGKNSLDLDDFQLWDISPSTGGAGGAAGTTGAAGAAGSSVAGGGSAGIAQAGAAGR